MTDRTQVDDAHRVIDPDLEDPTRPRPARRRRRRAGAVTVALLALAGLGHVSNVLGVADYAQQHHWLPGSSGHPHTPHALPSRHSTASVTTLPAPTQSPPAASKPDTATAPRLPVRSEATLATGSGTSPVAHKAAGARRTATADQPRPRNQYFEHIHTALCLTDSSTGEVVVSSCNITDARDTSQYWKVTHWTNGSSKLRNAATNRCLTAADGNEVTAEPCDQSLSQGWFQRSDVALGFRSASDGTCLGVNASGPNNVVTATCRDQDGQRWE